MAAAAAVLTALFNIQNAASVFRPEIRHGAADKFVPVEMTYENYEACASPKKLFIVPGADHAMSYLKDREGYEKTVKDFWKEFD